PGVEQGLRIDRAQAFPCAHGAPSLVIPVNTPRPGRSDSGAGARASVAGLLFGQLPALLVDLVGGVDLLLIGAVHRLQLLGPPVEIGGLLLQLARAIGLARGGGGAGRRGGGAAFSRRLLLAGRES